VLPPRWATWRRGAAAQWQTKRHYIGGQACGNAAPLIAEYTGDPYFRVHGKRRPPNQVDLLKRVAIRQPLSRKLKVCKCGEYMQLVPADGKGTSRVGLDLEHGGSKLLYSNYLTRDKLCLFARCDLEQTGRDG
jgi:hypothetical protein